MLELSADEVLRTTRTVRKRLDFDRPVERSVIEECLEIAIQAPNGGNMNNWRWLAIDDPGLIKQIADIYNGGLDDFIATFDERGYAGGNVPGADRIETSTQHLRDNFHRCPALLLPIVAGRTDGGGEGANVFHQASRWGSVLQAVWSFMLALRSRGLGSAWTTGHLWREKQLAELLGIPYDHYMQTGLFPIAYTIGTDFKPAYRKPVKDVLAWNQFDLSG
ncbi:MAG: nitroreductase family protein [Deltaproteobacteria bacterium]|nr:nitroreductase family protein [Deltaproteobacteria bacterium]